jgi:hypothetical protein
MGGRRRGAGFARALRYEGGDLGDKERQILECLGAAVVSRWNELPTDVQRAIFQHAAANKTYDPARLRAQIAHFPHNHKDDADTPYGVPKSRTVSRILDLPETRARTA